MTLHRITPTLQAVGLLCWLLLTFAAAGLGAAASVNAGSFYAQLMRPAWAPPGWLFGPVWTLLYTMMGVAAWLVWRAHGFRGAGTALLLYVLQLLANALWTWLFFQWRQGALAFAEIVVLWLVLLATVLAFRRLNSWAGLLLLPYVAWVSFAGALTYVTWQLNPQILG